LQFSFSHFANYLIDVKFVRRYGYHMADIAPITRERIAQTEKTIRPFVRRTPLVRVDGADFGLPRVH
jgi:hypothetical protein